MQAAFARVRSELVPMLGGVQATGPDQPCNGGVHVSYHTNNAGEIDVVYGENNRDCVTVMWGENHLRVCPMGEGFSARFNVGAREYADYRSYDTLDVVFEYVLR